jgi:hypothetical protein
MVSALPNPDPTLDQAKLPKWWGIQTLGAGQRARLNLGPLRLYVENLDGEWRLFAQREGQPQDLTCALDFPWDGELPDAGEWHRFAVAEGGEAITLLPRLADRPVVGRPENPFFILPGEQTRIFVTTPLWVAVSLPGEAERSLLDLPVARPKDTFFGPNTTAGQICYASRTFCRLRFGDVPPYPHRAITAVQIKNEADDPLPVERLRIPVQHLALYQDDQNRLWTEEIALVRVQTATGPQLQTRDRNWKNAPTKTRRIGEPRLSEAEPNLVRSFATLFQG